jgi:VWFA-related protein
MFSIPRLSAQDAATPPVPPNSSPTPSEPLRVYSREVVVDINVTDAKGNPVHGLKQSDFTVLENNQPMSPRTFREHRIDEPADPASTPAPPTLPKNTFSNAAPPEGIRPLQILLLDSLNTPIATQSNLRQQMIAFVEKSPAGTRMALFNLSATGQLSMIQGFTTDQELLKKAIKSHKFDIGIPPLEDFGQEPDSQLAARPMDDKRSTKAFEDAKPKVDQTVECNHAADRVQYTSNAFALIARYTSGMPGRKNLIWYTGAFPNMMNDKQGSLCYDSREDISSADALLERAHVVVYPIDPRALDIIASQGSTSRIARIQANEHLEMEAVAAQTGGQAFYNNNDMAALANKAIDAGTNYYTIIYVPTNQTMDTRKRNITVNVDQPDLTLVYKHTYNAVLPGRPTTVGGRPFEKATPLQTAMMRGAPQPTEVLFHVATAVAPIPDTTLPPGNNPDPKAMKPPFRHLTLSYTIDINGLQFDPGADGNYHGQFEYAVTAYDSNDGKPVNSIVMAAKPALPPAVYQSMLASGAKLRQEIDIPVKGEYILRIGVHDLTTDRVGALEIPTSSITP